MQSILALLKFLRYCLGIFIFIYLYIYIFLLLMSQESSKIQVWQYCLCGKRKNSYLLPLLLWYQLVQLSFLQRSITEQVLFLILSWKSLAELLPYFKASS